MADSSNKAGSIYRHMASGTAWAVAMRWSMRLIGLASMVVLARLLTPADFGIVAMASIYIAFIEGFAELGTSMVLLREREISRADCDTAWTIRLLQGVFVALILVLSAPLAAKYFSEPRLIPVVWVLAACSAIGGLENIGLVLIRRELDFAKDFRFNLYQKVCKVGPTLVLAFALRDYWALAWGQLLGSLFSCALSYRMHPYRPRLSLEKLSHYLNFSLSVVMLNVGAFLRERTGGIVVGGSANAAMLGAFNVASELATMSTREIVTPMWRALFPTMSKISADSEQFRDAFGHMLSTVAILCLPLGLGLCTVAADFIAVVLGYQWRHAVPLIRWLAIASTIMSLVQMAGIVLIVSGHERRNAYLTWMHLAIMVPLLVCGGLLSGVEAVAAMTALSVVLMLPIAAFALKSSIGFGYVRMLKSIWRPSLAVAIMMLVIQWLPAHQSWHPVSRLVFQTGVGALVYTAALGALWRVSGCPAGLEQVAWQAIERLCASIRRLPD